MDTPRPRLTPTLLFLGPICALILIESGKDYLTLLSRGRQEPYLRVLLGSAEWWGAWALLLPLGVPLWRRAQAVGGARAALLHGAGALLGCAAHLLLAGAAFYATHGHRVHRTLSGQLSSFFEVYFMLDLLTYVTIVGGYLGMDLYRRYQEGERRAAALLLQAERLKAQTAQAQLQALRQELHPHFLFNTLNAACGLARRQDADGVVRVLERLGELLRATLGRGGETEVPLARELELLSAYLEIERTRFHDRLAVAVDVPAELTGARVPPLLLQPLVENAVRYGVARVPGPGRVAVRAWAEGGSLHIEVLDSGPGFPPAGRWTEGIGLGNTRARLQQMYGGEAALALSNLPERGARVHVRLPLRAGGGA